MLRAIDVHRSTAIVSSVVDRVVLDYDQRHRRRIVMTGERGTEFLLDLEKPARLRGGDVLQLDDGRLIAIAAANEALASITCAAPGGLVRIAWHIGNRHLPAMLSANLILIRCDHVIEEMASGLGGSITHVEAPFEPEAGAYAGGHRHHHHDS